MISRSWAFQRVISRRFCSKFFCSSSSSLLLFFCYLFKFLLRRSTQTRATWCHKKYTHTHTYTHLVQESAKRKWKQIKLKSCRVHKMQFCHISLVFLFSYFVFLISVFISFNFFAALFHFVLNESELKKFFDFRALLPRALSFSFSSISLSCIFGLMYTTI